MTLIIHFIARVSMVVQVSVVLKKTVYGEIAWCFEKPNGSFCRTILNMPCIKIQFPPFLKSSNFKWNPRCWPSWPGWHNRPSAAPQPMIFTSSCKELHTLSIKGEILQDIATSQKMNGWGSLTTFFNFLVGVGGDGEYYCWGYVQRLRTDW